MRSIAFMILLAGLSVPGLAYAGASGDAVYKKSVEQGVTVYRAQPSQENAAYVANLHQQYVQRQQKADLKRKIYKQQRQIAAQKKSIAALETRLTKVEAQKTTHTRQRRSRYNRSYYGNPRFFGPNGFRGNSNFSGATVKTNLPPRRGIGRRY